MTWGITPISTLFDPDDEDDLVRARLNCDFVAGNRGWKFIREEIKRIEDSPEHKKMRDDIERCKGVDLSNYKACIRYYQEEVNDNA